MKTKTVQINSKNCAEINLFTTKDADNETCVLIQAWHYFGSEWHYQCDNIYFDYPSSFENFIENFSVKSAEDFARDFKINCK